MCGVVFCGPDRMLTNHAGNRPITSSDLLWARLVRRGGGSMTRALEVTPMRLAGLTPSSRAGV